MRIHVYPKSDRHIRVAVDVVYRIGHETPSPHWDIDLQDCPVITELSMVGTVWENGREVTSCQCVDYIRSLFQYESDVAKDMRRLCDLWDRWHLNGTRAGSRAQQEALRDFKHEYDWYEEACTYLLCKGLYEVEANGRKYTFAYAWLAEPLPGEVIDEINAIVARLGDE